MYHRREALSLTWFFYPSVVAFTSLIVCLSPCIFPFSLDCLKVLQDSPSQYSFPSKTFVLGFLFKALPLSLRVPDPCDHLRCQIPCAHRTLRPWTLTLLLVAPTQRNRNPCPSIHRSRQSPLLQRSQENWPTSRQIFTRARAVQHPPGIQTRSNEPG